MRSRWFANGIDLSFYGGTGLNLYLGTSNLKVRNAYGSGSGLDASWNSLSCCNRSTNDEGDTTTGGRSAAVL